MDWMSYARFALALLFVLALIGVLTALARRFGLGGVASTRGAGKRRLGMAEVLAIDGKRRLVLVRRDDTEHLLLIGGETDLVIEHGITADRRPASFQHALGLTEAAAPRPAETFAPPGGQPPANPGRP